MKADTVEAALRPARKRDGIGAKLFAGLLGRGGDEALDIPTAVMVPIVGAMLADGLVEEEELFQIDAVCAFSPIFDRNASYENELLIIRATRLIEDHGLEKMCLRAAAILSPALRETAFVYAVKVIFSDGRYGPVEQAVIGQIRNWLQIGPDRARAFIEVISVMRRNADA
jgi:tellurite resistance protein